MKRIACLLALSLLGLALNAQLQFQSAVDKTAAQVGEAVRFNFGLEGSDQIQLPDWHDDADFYVQFEGGAPRNSTTTYSINGQTTTQIRKSYVGSYLLRPKHEGVLRIAAHNFRSQGQVFSSDPASITVSAARKNANYLLRWSVPSTSLVEGQPIRLKLEFLYAQNVKALNFFFPFLDNPDFKWDNPVTPSGQPGDLLAFPVGGRQWLGRRATATQGGRQYNSVELILTGHSTRTGTLTLEGLAADISGKTGTQTVRDFFGQEVQQDSYEDFSLHADPLVLSVKALPQVGKPAGYTGLVGQIAIKADLGVSSVGLGDPLDLKVQVTGIQNQVDPQTELEGQLTNRSGLQVSLKDRKLAEDGTLNYTFIVRFTKPGPQAIEPLTLDYFEPQADQYRQASSARIAVQVQDATLVAAANVVGSWGNQVGQSQVLPDRALFDNAESGSVLDSYLPVWLAPLVVLPVWVLALIARWWRGDPRRVRRQALKGLINLADWDEAKLGAWLPVEWTEWHDSFDRLRYSPPGNQRQTWLRDLQAFCRKELQR